MGMKDFLVKQEEINKKEEEGRRIQEDRERIKKLIEQEEKNPDGISGDENETPS